MQHIVGLQCSLFLSSQGKCNSNLDLDLKLPLCIGIIGDNLS